MYFATNPPALEICCEQQRWYALITSRRSSGSSRADSAVDPTRSQNMMVSCLRSAEVCEGTALSAEPDGVLGACCPAAVSFWPHCKQNLAPGGFVCRHEGHWSDRARSEE